MTSPAPILKRDGPSRRRLLQVERVEELSESFRRITFGGPDLVDFPFDRHGAHGRLFFPRADERPEEFARAVAGSDDRPKRTYTIRQRDGATGTVDIDFMVHGDSGLAGPWARHAKPGDVIGMAGPGRRKMAQFDAAAYVLVADGTGLPVVATILEDLPRDATGHAILIVPHRSDRQALRAPDGVRLTWRVSHDPRPVVDSIERTLGALDMPTDTCVLAVAEASLMRAVRRHAMDIRGITGPRLLTSGYWKVGMDEDALRVAKKSPDWFGDPERSK